MSYPYYNQQQGNSSQLPQFSGTGNGFTGNGGIFGYTPNVGNQYQQPSNYGIVNLSGQQPPNDFGIGGFRPGGGLGGGGGGGTGFDWNNFMFGNSGSQGALGVGANLLQTGLGAWLGWKNYKLAQDQYKLQKGAFLKNLQNQTTLTNQQIIDRQTNRYRNAPDMYQNPNDPNWRKNNLLRSDDMNV